MKQEMKTELANKVFNLLHRASLQVPFFFEGNNNITLRPFADPNAAKELTIAIVNEVVATVEHGEKANVEAQGSASEVPTTTEGQVVS